MRGKHIAISMGLILAPWIGLRAQEAMPAMWHLLLAGPVGAPVANASIICLDSNLATQTNASGFAMLPSATIGQRWVIDAQGFAPDTITLSAETPTIKKKLVAVLEQAETQVTTQRGGLAVDYLNPIMTEKIGAKELQKAACCNLSESFETNPAIDASFADALSGQRQITLLGLSGIYAPMMLENVPYTRGIGAATGLSQIPGSWIEQISLAKGVGSVVNGFENMTGQLNVSIPMPEEGVPHALTLNGYVNHYGRLEGNAVYRTYLSPTVSTTLLAHANTMRGWPNMDQNGDGFMDMQRNKALAIANQWNLNLGPSWVMRAGGSIYRDIGNGGQEHATEQHQGHLADSSYKINSDNERYQGYLKASRVWADAPWRSVGIISQATKQHQTFNFGPRFFAADQMSASANVFYSGRIASKRNTFKVGIAYQYDNVTEAATLGQKSGLGAIRISPLGNAGSSYLADRIGRKEQVIGAYYEHNYAPMPSLTFLPAIRVDYSNLHGLFVTPRFHARWQATEKAVFRISAGRGQRSHLLFMDQPGVLASNRTLLLPNIDSADIRSRFGATKPEVSYTTGASWQQDFSLGEQAFVLSSEAFYTYFKRQWLANVETAEEVNYENQAAGKAQSLAAQVMLESTVAEKLELRLAYRYTKSMILLDGNLFGGSGRQRPLTPQHRALLNAAYKAGKGWLLDATLSVTGPKRVPGNGLVQPPYSSPSVFMLQAQITKKFARKLDIYAGLENILNVRQHNPIIAAASPFSPGFDASQAWGPIVGRIGYVGVRWVL